MKTNYTALTLRFFWQHLRRYKLAITLAYLFSALTTLTGSIASTFFFKEAIDVMTEFTGPDRSVVMGELMRLFGLIIGLNVFAYSISMRLSDWALVHFAARAMKDMENSIFGKLIAHSYHFFANHFVGSLVSKSNRLVRSFERMIDISILNLWPTLIQFGLALGILSFFVPHIALYMALWAGVYCIIIYILTMRYTLPRDRINAAADSRVTAHFADPMTNTFNIKTFARKRYEIKRFLDITAYRLGTRLRSWHFHTVMNLVQASLMTGIQAVVFYILFRDWGQNLISVGTIVLVQGYLIQLYMNLWGLGGVIRDLYRAFADSEEMIDIIHQTPDILDPPQPEAVSIQQGKIEFQNVHFTYEGKTKLFEDFNITIKPGEKIGLVGESGSGKSTFTKLLLRFMDIDDGQILIDGQNIARISQEDLRRHIAYVPQEPVLFHRSLLENIRYGQIEASDEAVYEAATNAHAHAFIMQTSEQYETLVGERGIKLSGGEKQRVAIARAMLKTAPILILDEATSSLDSKAETLIQDALDRLMAERTTIVIAHRLSTIQKMDRIIVLDHGEIVEMGSHTELLAKDGKYAELWSHQVGGFLVE